MEINYKDYTILIVEDDPNLLSSLTMKLQTIGFNVINAQNGQEGLNTALSEHPHLILSDILMPQMDGLTTLELLRQDVWGKNVPVIIMTNMIDEKIKESILSYDKCWYLVKANSSMSEIVELVKEKLGIN